MDPCVDEVLLCQSEPAWKCEAHAGRDHRCSPGVNGLNDLVGVNALQVDRGHAEVAVAELALDDVERDAFVGELDGVGVAELVGCGASEGFWGGGGGGGGGGRGGGGGAGGPPGGGGGGGARRGARGGG